VLLIATPVVAQVRGEILGPGATRLPVAVPEPLMPGQRRRRRTRVRARCADWAFRIFRVINPTAYIRRE
jgi:hypothetical protein